MVKRFSKAMVRMLRTQPFLEPRLASVYNVYKKKFYFLPRQNLSSRSGYVFCVLPAIFHAGVTSLTTQLQTRDLASMLLRFKVPFMVSY